MIEIELRERVVSQAMSWIGKKEANGSHKEIIDVYNSIQPLPSGYRMKYTDPWCAAFVSAVAWKCGMTKYIFPSASCPRMIEMYQKAGRWMEDDNYLPHIGDIIFYDWDDNGVGDNKGVADHVGIISNVFSNSFNIVEGNYSDAVKQRTMGRNAKNIRGFGLPDYATAAGVVGVSSSTTQPSTPTTTPSQPSTPKEVVLRKGMKGSAVKEMQEMLIKSGYDLPKYGADGSFGEETWLAVLRYQRANKLNVDGEVGPETLACLKKTSATNSGNDEIIVSDPSWTPAVGDIVEFTGDKHYISANSNVGYKCKGGKAKITSIYKPGKSAHPYHLVNQGGGCTVYGWVDAGTFRKA